MKSTFADWTADADDAGFYGGEKRQRGGKKKRKKNTETRVVTQNWDDIYDPSRPNNYDDYKNSEEKIAEIREWKDRLYAHRYARDRSSESGSDSDYGYGRRMNSELPTKASFLLTLNTLQTDSHHLPLLKIRRRHLLLLPKFQNLRLPLHLITQLGKMLSNGGNVSRSSLISLLRLLKMTLRLLHHLLRLQDHSRLKKNP